MKKIIGILAALMMCFTLSSCVTAAQAQVDGAYDDDVDISVVVTYGTPYYNTEGLLLYYIYRDMFYYPYYYHNRYYLHRYHRPLPPERMRMYKPVPRDFYRHEPPRRYHRPLPPERMRMYRPVPRDFYRHEPPRRYHVTPPNRSTQHMRPNTHPTQPRPNGNIRPNGGMRPNTNVRPNNNRGGNVGRPMTPRSSTRATVGGGNRGHFGGRR